MKKTRQEKERMVEELTEKLSQAESAVLVDYRGLDVAQMNELRRQLGDSNVDFKVVKNTLTSIAAENAGIDEINQYLEGPVGIAFGYDDPVVPAKILNDFSKENEELEFKAAILGESVVGEEKVKNLAKLPSREELLGKVAGTFQAPIAGFAGACQGIIRKFVYAVDAVRQEKEDAS
ncbi:ribosomal protein L10 [Natranaerobius thermophilus JW/NM-WN-LF]|uniref:Large ribosomal subunit protein uL10 n=1 Tax=Natranaerobius thermophilus (strain ATCC BAA-1301 / DSM 18059 / JW/NM-WN-LF) TaxID=457570 RepID=RL10_NATTJ|nr:RecName: Full=Large ribosomal subunit protein uL10; AltName: Full=50S ribosomal protein L10 [Natranaerobius thermophilus JW/NM-WN-LF]ACB83782.1 ribosomal protein L10 [Natranaerobius thermophilus JW/NM-WN-LF]